MTDDPPEALVEALTAARENPPWNAAAVLEYGHAPADAKRRAVACQDCAERPCEADEVCATMLAREVGLLDEVGRDQAFHLVESGMERVRTQGRAEIRDADRPRPNTFVRLTDDARANAQDPTGDDQSRPSEETSDT